MSEDQRRPEATHRQRADLGRVEAGLPIDEDGRPMAIISCSASDLVPTVQFGNVLVGPVTITRAVPDDGIDSIIQAARELQNAAEYVAAAERRIIQWAIDPSTKVINPATGAIVMPNGDVPAPAEAPAQPADQRDPAAVAPPPSAQ